MSILDFQKPDEVIMINEEDNKGIFEFRPLEPGYGLTVGNALRRVLLSSLEGYAITSIRVTGAEHEFTTIKGVVQDIAEIILNLKQIRFKQQIDTVEDETAVLKVSKSGTVTAANVASTDLGIFWSNSSDADGEQVEYTLDLCVAEFDDCFDTTMTTTNLFIPYEDLYGAIVDTTGITMLNITWNVYAYNGR